MARKFRIARTHRPAARPSPVKLALVLSGAVALGSFEAGVVYEILRAIQAGAPISLDIIVGSSAGALVGAMTAKCLVAGVPFETVIPRWTEYTLQQLTAKYETADQARLRGHPLDRGILSSEAIRRILEENLVADPVDRSFQPAHPAPRVMLTVALTNLDGLPDLQRAEVDHRFAEVVTFRFTPPDPEHLARSHYPPAVWKRIARACRASSAFPGAFDPEYLPWAERMVVPGLIEEVWENQDLLEQLHRADPTIQPKMRYGDGGILDEHPVERAITVLPHLVGRGRNAGEETLVYDPRRCVLFVEPDPPTTSIDALKAGTSQSWFETFGRALRLWTLSASPSTSQRRVTVTNRRQERLFQFLVNLARQMREGGEAPATGRIVLDFHRLYPDLSLLQRMGTAAGGLGEPPGLIDPELYRKAVHRFYQWLSNDQRFKEDIGWLDQLPPGHMRDLHRSMRTILLDLRDAYLALEAIGPLAPSHYQSVLEGVHADLAESLGLSQPWVALQRITVEDPRQMLKGEGIAHFGGFFSREFLQHDYDVGRYHAHLWLKEVVPDFVPPQGPAKPPITQDGLSLGLLWKNRIPLWRMAGRFVGAVLESLGLSYDRTGKLLVRLLGWSLLLSLLHGLLLLLGAWFGWVAFQPQYQRLRFWLLLGTSLFPLTFGLCLGLTLRANLLQQLRARANRKPATGAKPTGGVSKGNQRG